MRPHLYAVIMAGGGGTRLWPLSRRDRPKQTLAMFSERTLVQLTADRLEGLVAADHVLVVATAALADQIKGQLPQVPGENYLLEPEPRGTASVVGWAATVLLQQDSDAVMVCLPADHFIQDGQRFRDLLVEAERLANEGHLVTLGIRPSAAETGYGYLEQGPPIESPSGYDVYEVEAFKEKPDADTAASYLASGDFAWNAGIFIWRCDVILRAVQAWMPDLARGLDLLAAAGEGAGASQLAEVWAGLRAETIDYGIMEKASDVVMVTADGLGWCDVGSWNRLFDLLEPDEHGNISAAGPALFVNSKSSLVFQTDSADKARLVALVGVENLIVVDVGDALLVTTRDRAEQVRDVVDLLDSLGRQDLK